ncbi:MAG: hypothetical protein QG622_2710 [Actinomycetota bacterium]|nr:hypothetical protein [Actinomycetota bacterium]
MDLSTVRMLRPTRTGIVTVTAASAAVAGVVVLGLAPSASAGPRRGPLPLGDSGLPETRRSEAIAPGVSLTRIVRGQGPAPAGEIGRTTKGPWRVDVLTIDPAHARGHLRATPGPDLKRAEPTTALVRGAGALAGINASFFSFTDSVEYPGELVGLGLFGGRLLSEPSANPAETHLFVDASTSKVSVGRFRWAGSVQNRRTKASLGVKAVNRPPVVPAPCAGTPGGATCTAAGEIVRFTHDFAPSTPPGPGAEVVLGSGGCVVRTSTARGTALLPGQTSLQATGDQVAPLLRTATGCLTHVDVLKNEAGKRIPLRSRHFAVSGRYRLLDRGKVVVPAGKSYFFGRHPRTLAGATRDGKIILATIDGRRVTSVGASLAETAAVAKSLGLYDAVNLDGGGSTTMSVRGTLTNQPSGSRERSVGDALVFVDSRYRA